MKGTEAVQEIALICTFQNHRVNILRLKRRVSRW